MVKTKYDISIKVAPFNCPAAGKVKTLVSELNANESLQAKIVLGNIAAMNMRYAYLEEEKPENAFGTVMAIKNTEGELDKDDIDLLVSSGNYEILLQSVKGNSFSGVLNVLTEEGLAYQKSDDTLKEELKVAIDKAVKNRIVTKPEILKRIKYMQENGIDEYLQLRIIKKYRKFNKPAHQPSCLFKDPYLEDSQKRKTEGIISEGLRAAATRNAIICEGEKSVGKNVYLETIAWLLNMPMYLITFSRNMSPSSIYGEKTTDNSAAQALAELDPAVIELAEKAEFAQRCFLQAGMKLGYKGKELDDYVEGMMPEEWKKALLEKAMFEKQKAQASSVNIVIDQSELYDWLIDGGVLVFNEMNMAEANFFASFTNQLLDGTGFLFIPGRGEVKIHPDCVLFGTQNADYQGVETQNEATMSRFGCLVFPQPKTIKAQIQVATMAAIKKGDSPEASLDKKYYTECENFYKQCRSAVNKGVVTNACLNIRGFVRALTAVAESNGYARLKRQLEIHVINTCPVDDRAALYATLEQLVTL